MFRTITVFSSLLVVGVFAGLVKRDTVDDIEESLSNMLPQEGCLMDSQCIEHIQYCNRENPLNMHCQFVVWVWVGLGVAVGVLLLAIFGSCLCCSCCFLSSLCRKK